MKTKLNTMATIIPEGTATSQMREKFAEQILGRICRKSYSKSLLDKILVYFIFPHVLKGQTQLNPFKALNLISSAKFELKCQFSWACGLKLVMSPKAGVPMFT